MANIPSPSAIPWGEGWHTPKEMDEKDMEKVRNDFLAAAKRALTAGFDVLEMHNAHGYLLQSFLSPIANQRKDQFGGSLENRMRFPLSVAKVLRDFWAERKTRCLSASRRSTELKAVLQSKKP